MLDRRAKLYFDYTIPLPARLTTAAKQGPEVYFKLYELEQPKEIKEKADGKAA